MRYFEMSSFRHKMYYRDLIFRLCIHLSSLSYSINDSVHLGDRFKLLIWVLYNPNFGI